MGENDKRDAEERSKILLEGRVSEGLYAYSDSMLIENKSAEGIKGTIIVSDVHLGYDYQYADTGIRFLLKGDDSVYSKILQLRKHYSNWLGIEADSIAFNGDIIDDFALKNVESRRSINLFFSRLSLKFRRVYLIRGNHDKMLDTLTLKDNCSISEYVILGHIIVMHGDRSIEELNAKDDMKKKGVNSIIIGHEHPVLRLNDGIREEKYKCIVIFDDVHLGTLISRIYLMPAFNPNIEGTDIMQQSFMSPLLTNAMSKRTRILVHDKNAGNVKGKFLDFGSVDDVKSL